MKKLTLLTFLLAFGSFLTFQDQKLHQSPCRSIASIQTKEVPQTCQQAQENLKGDLESLTYELTLPISFIGAPLEDQDRVGNNQIWSTVSFLENTDYSSQGLFSELSSRYEKLHESPYIPSYHRGLIASNQAVAHEFSLFLPDLQGPTLIQPRTYSF